MTFGDFTVDDAADVEPPDAEQVARRLHLLRRRRQHGLPSWDRLNARQKRDAVAVVVELLAWLHRQRPT